MFIVGIDPGPTQSGFAVLKDGVVVQSGTQENAWIREFITESCEELGIGVAIEQVRSYGMAVGAEVFDTCVETGRFVECTGGAAILVPRMDVKMHLCKSPKAKDANIRQALIDRFGSHRKGGPLYGVSGHAWAALAVAVTAADKVRVECLAVAGEVCAALDSLEGK